MYALIRWLEKTNQGQLIGNACLTTTMRMCQFLPIDQSTLSIIVGLRFRSAALDGLVV
ncbi:hypothetical protein PR202_ga31257 [Eleusine coracana subsp. coracana]|uniref:Uncharacterized protein n=1 Tax=Eleusine coracana subsp. coracana TaxID=191504 RepID=A0AAV5DRT9_ELECO|nr:hypothetical protein PR202_ga31257 [Eleusine coracana subsp. coracana]